MSEPIISVQNLKKYFGKTKAVDGVSFEVEKGEIFGFLGPNGAGKTTTIRCMMDFVRPDEGSVTILEQDAHQNTTSLKEDVGFLPGEVFLYENWTGQEHVNFVRSTRSTIDSADELYRRLHFDSTKKVKELSSGNKQKLGLILAFMHDPKVLILDEPTSGLDPFLQHTVYEILREHAEKESTVFMSSHNLSEVERVCDRVCIIREGKVVTIERVQDMKRNRLYTIRAYFHGPPPTQDFIKNGCHIEETFEDGFVLHVKVEVVPILSQLINFGLKDIEITHVSLEEMFVEYYR